MGAIIRKHESLVTRTMCTNKRFRGDVFTIENYTFIHAIMFCQEAGFEDLILEGDTKQVVNVVKENEPNWSASALIIQDAKFLL